MFQESGGVSIKYQTSFAQKKIIKCRINIDMMPESKAQTLFKNTEIMINVVRK